MNKKQKKVLLYLCSVCLQKRTYLVSPQDIALNLSKNFVLSSSEIDEIMVDLSKQDYLDFIITEKHNDYIYCVTLKKKGQNYKHIVKEQKHNFYMVLLRTIFLAFVSFLFGIILKAIFT